MEVRVARSVESLVQLATIAPRVVAVGLAGGWSNSVWRVGAPRDEPTGGVESRIVGERLCARPEFGLIGRSGPPGDVVLANTVCSWLVFVYAAGVAVQVASSWLFEHVNELDTEGKIASTAPPKSARDFHCIIAIEWTLVVLSG